MLLVRAERGNPVWARPFVAGGPTVRKADPLAGVG